jgi:hypothetical protein
MNQDSKRAKVLILIGLLFLIYAFLGNYVALPGYIRFLESGRTSVNGQFICCGCSHRSEARISFATPARSIVSIPSAINL